MDDENMISKRRILKLFLLCIILVAINILAFSKAAFGISIHSDNLFAIICSIFIPIFSVIIFFVEGNSILNQKDKARCIELDELKEDSSDYKKKIKQVQKDLPFLTDELNELKNQIRRMDKKQEALFEYIKQNNKNEDLLKDEAKKARQFLLNNAKIILSKCIIIGALDQDVTITDFRNIYQEQIQDFKRIIKFNEKILDEFDCFLEEVIKSGASPVEDNISLQSTIEALRQIRQMNNKE